MTKPTITVQIRSRRTDEPIYTTELPADTPSGMRTRVALEQAVSDRADLSEADLRWANLSEADLSEADLRWADLRWANLSEADLSEADLRWADLRGANLSEADLSEADLSEADLRWANLSEADLRGADLRGADLSEADLRWADLRGANLSEADLSEADLSGADLREIRNLWGTTGNRQRIKSMQIDTWSVTYTSTHMQIGCQLHPLERWWGFSDGQIDYMDGRALEWWHKWKPVLQQIVSMSPAEPCAEKPADNQAADAVDAT